MSDPESYCRDIEAYLCRKNDGHLVRIVGPAFEIVTGWSRQGIPLKVACAGIDRYFERYYRRGPRRRPVRVEFCEADVLDAFDDWRRAIGLSAARAAGAEDQAGSEKGAEAALERPRRGPSLASHVEQALQRLTLLRASTAPRLLPDDVLAESVRALDALKADASRARGEAREAVIAALAELDRKMIAAAAERLDPEGRARLEVEAERELAPFRARMPAEAYARSREAALARLIREQFLLPRLSYE